MYRRVRALLLAIVVIGGSVGGFYIYVQFRPLQYLSVTVDYALLPPAGSARTVLPTYNTLNIWDIDWFLDPANNATLYHEKYYFLDQLVVMTATGGRNTNSNEYINISSDGTVTYNFTKLERMIDWLKEGNFTPIFVIGNTPIALTADKTHVNYGAFGANTAEPADYNAYYNFVVALVQDLLAYGGASFLSTWTWRVYTEPDNPDWLNGTLDAYFRIYNATAHAIRSVLPDAKLETGNMMTRDLDNAHLNFFAKLQAETPEIFPNVTAFSVYGFIGGDLYLTDPFAKIAQWHDYFNSIGRSQVSIVIEEGQILADEDGKRLWDGDSTELGGAFYASAYTQCETHNVSRYTTWEFYSTDIRTPALNVVDMFQKMTGEIIAPVDLAYEPLTIPQKQTFGALASRAANNATCHLLLYNLVRNRNDINNVSVTVTLNNLPAGLSKKNLYVVDKTHSNFHVEWDPLAVNFTYHPSGTAGINDGSRYDVALGIVLQGDDRDFYYQWSWANQGRFPLEQVSSETFTAGSSYSFTVTIGANAVVLLELA
ncbi:MAG TPA: hypothetical protein VKK79_03205 [Candidatus Lokiarchaeia archaeon]|nr:hypothetical protein [Candidatus Lokiarchaeia archaeon]